MNLLAGEILPYIEKVSVIGEPLLIPGNILRVANDKTWKVLQINPACLAIDDKRKDAKCSLGIVNVQNLFVDKDGKTTQFSETMSRGSRPIMKVAEDESEKWVILGVKDKKSCYQIVEEKDLSKFGEDMTSWDETKAIYELSEVNCEKYNDLSPELHDKLELVHKATVVYDQLAKLIQEVRLPATWSMIFAQSIFVGLSSMKIWSDGMAISAGFTAFMVGIGIVQYQHDRIGKVKKIIHKNIQQGDINSLAVLKYKTDTEKR